MIKGGKGGGNTLTGLNFEKEKDILELLSNTKGYSVKGHIISYNGKEGRNASGICLLIQ